MKQIIESLHQIISNFPNRNLDSEFNSLVSRLKNKDEIEYAQLTYKILQHIKDLSTELDQNERRNQGVLDTMLDALITINDRGIIQSANKATEKIFGYNSQELIGKNIKILMPEPYHSEHDGYLRNYKQSGQKKVIGVGREVRARRKDGTTFPAHLAVGEALINNELIFTGTVKDISGQKEAEKNLYDRNQILEEQAWIKSELSKITAIAQSAKDLKSLCKDVLSQIAKTLEIGHGAFYLRESDDNNSFKNSLKIQSSYAFKSRKNLSSIIQFEDGIVGQCAYEKLPILLTNVPSDYIKIGSALGEAKPLNILTQPIIFEDILLGVIEIASFHEITEKQQNLLSQITDSLSIAINSVLARQRTEKLLQESQKLAEQLKVQQEELEHSNEELKEKTNRLEDSERELKAQQQELEAANEELEKNTVQLKEKQRELELSQTEIETSKKVVEEKAKELESASKYKSQFLANMSHELRTPLNSLLLLSNKLKDNDEGNLTKDQVKMLECIHDGGKDLLYLINDILDISKVESGMLEIQENETLLSDLSETLKDTFQPLALEKKIEFSIDYDESLQSLYTDSFRLQQILKNLLSNAFKFTEEGSVRLEISKPTPTTKFSSNKLNQDNSIVFSVSDTGIGISTDKLNLIFDAFKQADGSTSRKYGGTGLGLTISKELAHLLGGEIQVQSEEGKGSTFRCILPVKENPNERIMSPPQIARNKNLDVTPRANQNNPILIVINDNLVADSLKKYVNDQGYEAILAESLEPIINNIESYQPRAIILNEDYGNQVLQNLSNNPATKNIPIHCIQTSTMSQVDDKNLAHIVNNFAKALTMIEEKGHAKINKVLVVDDNPTTLRQVKGCLTNANVVIKTETTAKHAIDKLIDEEFDCLVLDYQLADLNAFEILKKIEGLGTVTLPPVVINTCRDLTKEEYVELKKYCKSIVIKGPYSEDRLAKEVGNFLNNIETNADKNKLSEAKSEIDEVLNGRCILIVDDDIRNTLALSTSLKKYDLDVIIADNGELALEKLEENPNIELIIMDVMMPIKDGYETIKDIRSDPRFKDMPIISLTASTMPEVKTKCIKLGANDFLTKPLDLDSLIPIMKLWLKNHDRSL